MAACSRVEDAAQVADVAAVDMPGFDLDDDLLELALARVDEVDQPSMPLSLPFLPLLPGSCHPGAGAR